MKTRWPIIPLALIALLLAIFATTQAIIAESTAFTPPPLRTDLLGDYSDSARVEQVSPNLFRLDGLPVVVVSGSPHDMGFQYGRALAAQIRTGLALYLDHQVTEEWHYPVDYQRRCAESMSKRIPPEFLEEMRGVAEGAGVDYDQVLRMHTHADMVHFGHGWGKPNAAPGMDCSNFAVWGRWTTNGQLLHGRNLDWATGTGVQQSACIYVGLPASGTPFALVTYAGCIGGVTGMNAAGLTFGEMTSSSSAETLDGMPLFVIVRNLLEHCRTIDEAVAMVKAYPRTTGWNFLMSDAKVPTARAFEVDAKNVVVFGPNDRTENDPPLHWPMPDCVRRTNHFLSREMQSRQCERVKIPYAAARAALRGLDTWRRYACLSQWIRDNRGKIDARLARALLQTAPVGGGGNLHSVIFEPGAKRMWVANAGWSEGKGHPAWEQHYVPVDLTRWWPAPH